MQKILAVVAILLVAAGNGCKSSKVTGPGASGRVLYIGNSYLYTKDIPGIVQSLAQSTGDDLTGASVAGPDMALYDHLETGGAVGAIMSGGWTYVVLQQGPSAVWYNRDSLRMAAAIFDGMAKQFSPNAKSALFSAWPQQQHRPDFPHAIESYRLAAADVDGVFMPVAAAWLRAWEYDPNLQLYEDGLHPSNEGAYLAALVVYASLLKKTPIGLPYSAGGVQVDAATGAMLQLAAASVTGFGG